MPVTGLLRHFVWTLNGSLVILYSAAGHFQTLLLALSSVLFMMAAPREQRFWAAGSGSLAVLASLAAPTPVPVFLLAMSLAGWAAWKLEQYNRPAQHWNTIRGQALYALAGLGFALFRNFGIEDAAATDPVLSQGAGYLNALVGVGMYVIPIGWLAMLTQSILAHPPGIRTPEALIANIRTRGKQ